MFPKTVIFSFLFSPHSTWKGRKSVRFHFFWIKTSLEGFSFLYKKNSSVFDGFFSFFRLSVQFFLRFIPAISTSLPLIMVTPGNEREMECNAKERKRFADIDSSHSFWWMKNKITCINMYIYYIIISKSNVPWHRHYGIACGFEQTFGKLDTILKRKTAHIHYRTASALEISVEWWYFALNWQKSVSA